MAGRDFHPLIQRWFKEQIGEPTAAQRLGWPAIRSGRDVLIAVAGEALEDEAPPVAVPRDAALHPANG